VYLPSVRVAGQSTYRVENTGTSDLAPSMSGQRLIDTGTDTHAQAQQSDLGLRAFPNWFRSVFRSTWRVGPLLPTGVETPSREIDSADTRDNE
jgi:hypothetical protein